MIIITGILRCGASTSASYPSSAEFSIEDSELHSSSELARLTSKLSN